MVIPFKRKKLATINEEIELSSTLKENTTIF
jgi:hypothetical protein